MTVTCETSTRCRTVVRSSEPATSRPRRVLAA